MADTLSHLIAIDPDTPTMPEEPGYEFYYAIFEEFLKVKTKTYEVNEVIVGTDTEIFKNDPGLQSSLQCIENPIAPQRLKKLQQQDPNIKILKRKLQNNRLDKEYYSLDENELLTRKVPSIYPVYSFFRYSGQPMMILVIMDFQEHMQPSNKSSSGKE